MSAGTQPPLLVSAPPRQPPTVTPGTGDAPAWSWGGRGTAPGWPPLGASVWGEEGGDAVTQVPGRAPVPPGAASAPSRPKSMGSGDRVLHPPGSTPPDLQEGFPDTARGRRGSRVRSVPPALGDQTSHAEHPPRRANRSRAEVGDSAGRPASKERACHLAATRGTTAAGGRGRGPGRGPGSRQARPTPQGSRRENQHQRLRRCRKCPLPPRSPKGLGAPSAAGPPSASPLSPEPGGRGRMQESETPGSGTRRAGRRPQAKGLEGRGLGSSMVRATGTTHLHFLLDPSPQPCLRAHQAPSKDEGSATLCRLWAPSLPRPERPALPPRGPCWKQMM
ncbi:basic salivary proline-rich protein 2-like [Hippopotamus amphibius kiboko]|uniref:basic salivary proline-rich protein 2-like n=1 Tax=Hippopotamus amphibius kiboko TaxID=575201 RepID=UPI00259202DF|nr:basic salivary proline-rich protein 2-like [Hippopotamus amphibius kiboko]